MKIEDDGQGEDAVKEKDDKETSPPRQNLPKNKNWSKNIFYWLFNQLFWSPLPILGQTRDPLEHLWLECNVEELWIVVWFAGDSVVVGADAFALTVGDS